MSNYKHINVEFEPHQLRMIEELNELTEKTRLADEYFKAKLVGKPGSEKDMLQNQIRTMREYRDILSERIKESIYDSVESGR